MIPQVISLRRSYACDFCNPVRKQTPEVKCTCYYPCEEWWCPEAPMDDSELSELDDG